MNWVFVKPIRIMVNQCAKVAGTLCGGKVQGTFAMKIFDCVKCDYYNSEHYQHNNSKITSNCSNNNCDI